MNTPFTYSFHKAIVTSMLFFGFTTLAVMAQTTPNTQPPTTPAKPAAAPVYAPSGPAVANQNPNAPVRIAPAQQPANRQVGSNPPNTDRSIPNSQFLNNQNAVPTNETETRALAGVGYNNPGGIVNSGALQNNTLNHVHYHYYYDSGGNPIGTANVGYAQTTYIDPSTVPSTSHSTMDRAYGPGNPAPMVNAGNMYVNNPNIRAGSSGVSTTWNPYLNNGMGMLTYGSGGSGVQGFND
ncbi:MAG: hypothetical protein EXS12_01875 [Phycisphaerales bacterium]|nr:hypothetical protein [Phycisphaerales bacterium]